MARKSEKKKKPKAEAVKKLLWSGKEPDVGARVTYTTDGKGKWWKRVSAKRCTEEVFMHDQCQGVHGHDGVHWCYNASGSFCWDDNEYDPKEGGCSGTTPPDHEKYVSPVEMVKHHYSSHGGEYVEVVDPELIAKLEKDELLGENVGVIRPVTDPKRLAHLDKIKKKNEKAAAKFMKGKKRPKDA